MRPKGEVMKSNNQQKIFLAGEGDAWYERNAGKLAQRADKPDRAVELVAALPEKPLRVLEVGCGDGWRLEKLAKLNESMELYGIDPSTVAVQAASGRVANINTVQGVADSLPYPDEYFNVLIYGGCLCWCDPDSLFRVACEGDRVLRDGGYVVVMDFFPPWPYRNPYHHRPGIVTYKMDYRQLFNWHPAYSCVHHEVFSCTGDSGDRDPGNQMAVSMLRKAMADAFPKRGLQ